ncbi:MAG TPA: AAA family ATPase [Gammaproteobacteria bacterium]|nr:AAA family ATPase [Gammaproteobacteria bacterium]
MYRSIEKQLQSWRTDPYRKPIILHGARQVGKTFTVRKFGAQFKNFVEVNFEETPQLESIFAVDLKPDRILRDLALALDTEIIPGETLLFLDEVQKAPRVLIALRYFYEKMPELHVIAAGSLLNFAIEQVGVPVGRVDFLYMYPMSWIEFLLANGNEAICKAILEHDPNTSESDVIHNKILDLLREYFAIGGMPEVVACWVKTHDPKICAKLQQAIINSYRQDFHKYAKDSQIKYVELVFTSAVRQLGCKFQFKHIPGEYRKRELAPALDLLEKACVVHKVQHTSGHGLPLGAELNDDKFKLIMLDVGLTQSLLGLNLGDWFLHGTPEFINKGDLVEAFVGQELLAYADPRYEAALYFWLREAETSSKASTAEVDYLIQHKATVIPLEVKSAKGSSLKSMHMFLESHTHSPYGIRYSTHNYSMQDIIKSYPLYAIPLSIDWKLEI